MKEKLISSTQIQSKNPHELLQYSSGEYVFFDVLEN